MTDAQRQVLLTAGLDPFSLRWAKAEDVGFPEWGPSEAVVLPDGRVLLGNGEACPPINRKDST